MKSPYYLSYDRESCEPIKVMTSPAEEAMILALAERIKQGKDWRKKNYNLSGPKGCHLFPFGIPF